MTREIIPLYHGRRNFLGSEDLVVSFYTQKCQFDCSFCDLPSKSSKTPVDPRYVMQQIDWVFDRYGEELPILEQLSAGNEGSILDERRFPPEAFDYLVRSSNEIPNLKVLSLETRPEYVNGRKLGRILDASKAVIVDVTVGFETQDDVLRNDVLNKRIGRKYFEDMIRLLGRTGVRLTSYVLLKPGPVMTDEEGVAEAITTAQYLADVCGEAGTELVIYLNPMYVAVNSPLAKAMRGYDYKPPRIQDIVRVIIEIKKLGLPVYTGLWSEGFAGEGGDFSSREDFDRRMRKAVKKFNENQDLSVFDSVKLENESCGFI